MQKSKFTETQIVGILKDARSGVSVPDLLRKYVGKCSGASVFRVKRLREPMGRFRIRRLIAAATVALCIVACGRSPVRSPATRVDALFAEWDRADSPGCSVGVSEHGATVYERSYGMANLETGTPISPGTVFHVASVSKQFTAMSILLLAERGQLSLDDPVAKYVPDWRDTGHPVTIHQVLTQTSGLRDGFVLRELAPRDRDESGALNERIVAILARQRGLNFAPGSQFEYSNSGYTLLAWIVQRVSGQSLRACEDANIFRPLAMLSTHVHDDPELIVPNRAAGYHRDDRGLHAAVHADLGHLVGTTGLFTNTRDLLRWEQNFATARVGSRATLDAMQKPTPLTGGGTSPYGYGLGLGEDRGGRYVEHGGGDPGYAAFVLRYPDRELAVTVLCNLDNIGIGIGVLTHRVAAAYFGDDSAVASSRTPPPPTRVAMSATELASGEGLYRDADDGRFGRLFVRDGKLMASPNAGTDTDTFELTPVGAKRFAIAGTDVAIELRRADGRPTELRITGDGASPRVMHRVEPYAPSPGELRAFAATYVSDDVDATYTIATQNGALVLRMPGRRDIALTPLVRDTFYGRLVNVVTFVHDSQGAVTGFRLSTDGVRALPFRRQPDRPPIAAR
jgi:CubicO group peptidase (beta-lactamase class C family)